MEQSYSTANSSDKWLGGVYLVVLTKGRLTGKDESVPAQYIRADRV